MRELVEHHDGHGLNDSIKLTCDDLNPNAGGASHHYRAVIEGSGDVAVIDFQEGPRNEPGSHAGVTEAVLYAVLIDRLRGFQAGPFACRESAIQLTKLEECLMWTRHRADERASRGVLGKNVK